MLTLLCRQLYDRLQRTIEALETLKREDIDGKEDIEVSMMDGKSIDW